jgi:hypothetical protein
MNAPFAIQCTDAATGKTSLCHNYNAAVDTADKVETFGTMEEADTVLAVWREMAATLEWNCTYEIVSYQKEAA